MTSPTNEVRSEIRNIRDKHCYFLMSASGASVAFLATQLDGLTLEYHSALVVIAIAAWSLSFFFGHRFLMIDEGLLWANHQYLQDLDTPLGQSIGHSRMQELFQEAMLPKSGQSEWCRFWQFFFICVGAAAFIGWKFATVYLEHNASGSLTP